MKIRTAFITGITGQDGGYLAEFLLGKGYRVFGMYRQSSSKNFWRIAHLEGELDLVEGDLAEQSSLDEAVRAIRPDEIYNLAAQAFVPTSFKQPVHTGNITGLGVVRMLEAMRRYAPKARFFQASSSEMFGKVRETPQKETTPFYPRSPYGFAKIYAHNITLNYRAAYRLFAVSGILFNHESPRRGLEFVTRKITDGVARVKHGLAKTLVLGNLDAKRDWGFAGDYVEAMWRMTRNTKPVDYVVATGKTHSVREFAALAFREAGLDWRKHVRTSEEFLRPTEVDVLRGNPGRIRRELGWKPKMGFPELVKTMVRADLARVQPAAKRP